MVALGIVVSGRSRVGFGGGFGVNLGVVVWVEGGSGSCGMVLPSESIIDEFCRKSEHLYCESSFAPV